LFPLISMANKKLKIIYSENSDPYRVPSTSVPVPSRPHPVPWAFSL